MAIAWLSVLKAVPWDDVISSAPKVADGAKKLWSSVAKKAPQADRTSGTTQAPIEHQTSSMAELEARLAQAEAATAELHQQMLDSSALIKALAEQNTQLIGRIEVCQARMRWLTGTTLVLGGVAVTALLMALNLAG
jgi:septal ring factor EnvC (AmiA/AmiB activator)